MGDSQVSVGQKKCVHLGFYLLRRFPLLTNMTPLKTWGRSLCSFTPCPATKDRIQDGEWNCFWHHQLLGFLSANLWQPDYVLEVILWCLLIKGLGALTVCLFSAGDGKYFLFSVAQNNSCFSLCISCKRSGPERFRRASVAQKKAQGRWQLFFLFWSLEWCLESGVIVMA